MVVEFIVNTLEDDWWFELGIVVQRTPFHDEKDWLMSIGFGFVSIYFRW